MTMRMALTVVAPAMRRAADVLLTADPATQMADIAAELASVIAGDTAERLAAPGYVGGQRQGARVLQFPGAGAQGPFALSLALPDAEPVPVPLYVNRRQVPPQLSLAEARIRDGAVVSLGDPDGCVSPEQAGLVEIRVSSGPAAGSIWRLSVGHWDIGSGHAADVCVGDPIVPAAALRIFVNGWGACPQCAHQPRSQG
jgi:S-DNA-T family DNA segregation ATPase FtsK/SpoIIIE